MAKKILLIFGFLLIYLVSYSQHTEIDIYDDVGIYNKAYARGAELQDTFITVSVPQAKKMITLHQRLQDALTTVETLTDISTRYQSLYDEQVKLVTAKNKELKLKEELIGNSGDQITNLQKRISAQDMSINRLTTVNKGLAQDLKKARRGRTLVTIGGVVVAATLTTLLLVN